MARGYDLLADGYLVRFGRSQVRDRWLQELIARVPVPARILDLGCGAGVPVARRLVEHGFDVLGVDGSKRQIELARANVPAGEFIHADMTALEFAPASFDAVAAFYSITHVPREEHAPLFKRIAAWLRPGGQFLASLGAGECADWLGLWLGVEMFFSHYDARTYQRLIRAAGLEVQQADVVDQDNDDARFLWVVARKLHKG
ncbi:MAG: class I SAM-dependent methyltransferase [Pseudolabrys sp.]|nr:class I SAM-dependent methyltransferase [Pseudolabrys sp.]